MARLLRLRSLRGHRASTLERERHRESHRRGCIDRPIRLQADLQEYTAEIVRRVIPALQQQILTTQLDRSLRALIDALRSAGYFETAETVEQAREDKAQSIGQIK